VEGLKKNTIKTQKWLSQSDKGTFDKPIEMLKIDIEGRNIILKDVLKIWLK
jgi:hypothetical protein